LSGVSERARLLGAALDIDSAGEKGTRLSVKLTKTGDNNGR